MAAAIDFRCYPFVALLFPIATVVLIISAADPLPVRVEEGQPVVPQVFSLQGASENGDLYQCTGVVIHSDEWGRTAADQNESCVAITTRSCAAMGMISLAPLDPPKAVFADGAVLDIIDHVFFKAPGISFGVTLLLLKGSRPERMLLPKTTARFHSVLHVFYSRLVPENDHMSMRTADTPLNVSADKLQGGPTFSLPHFPQGNMREIDMPLHFVNDKGDGVLVAIYEQQEGKFINCRAFSEIIDRERLPKTWRDMSTMTGSPWEFDGQCGVAPPSRYRVFANNNATFPHEAQQPLLSYVRGRDEPLDVALLHPWLISVQRQSQGRAPEHVGAAVFVPARAHVPRSDIALTTSEICNTIINGYLRNSTDRYFAVFGLHDKDEAGAERVERVEIEACLWYHVSGIIKFKEPKNFTESARPACVTTEQIETGENNTSAVILSWSAVGNSSHQLRQIPVRIVEHGRCGITSHFKELICIDAYGKNTSREYRWWDIGGPILQKDHNRVFTVMGLLAPKSHDELRIDGTLPMFSMRLSIYAGRKSFDTWLKQLSSLW